MLSTFTLDQIAALSELLRRTVRYYIQSGLIDRPQGIGKGAYYTQHHVEQLLVVRKWQLTGLSLKNRQFRHEAAECTRWLVPSQPPSLPPPHWAMFHAIATYSVLDCGRYL